MLRKLRKIGTSRGVVIPPDLAALCGLEIGDTLEFEYLGVGSIRITRREPEPPQTREPESEGKPEPDLGHQGGED